MMTHLNIDKIMNKRNEAGVMGPHYTNLLGRIVKYCLEKY